MLCGLWISWVKQLLGYGVLWSVDGWELSPLCADIKALGHPQ